MRLTPDKIKQGILHPAQVARDACVYWIEDSFSTDPEIVPLVGRADEEHGWGLAFRRYSFLARLGRTGQSTRWASVDIGCAAGVVLSTDSPPSGANAAARPSKATRLRPGSRR